MKVLEEANITGYFLRNIQKNPDKTAFVFGSEKKPDLNISRSTFLQRASSFAVNYQKIEGTEQKIICVCLENSLDLNAAFFGAMLSGDIPTMFAPPSPRMEKQKYAQSFSKMLSHVKPDIVLTSKAIWQQVKDETESSTQATILYAKDVIDLHEKIEPSYWLSKLKCDPSDIAFLQHSSGTTGLQKGVGLSHYSVINQFNSYVKSLKISEEDTMVSWLPLYHDMGLIACFIVPLMLGAPVVQLSPFEWVARPVLLLEKITKHKAAFVWLPNFAFNFIANSLRSSQKEDLDLSSIKAFINCSEPVMGFSFDLFLEKLKEVGVERRQLSSSYAMAENVFAVTQNEPGIEPLRDKIKRKPFNESHLCVPALNGEDYFEFVSSGKLIDGVDLKIIDKNSKELSEGKVGEILIAGKSLFAGYYKKPDLSKEAFSGNWYKTGDLGYLKDSNLYVTGRKKDLLIIQGRNFYPGDIEAVISEVHGVVPGRVSVFGIDDKISGTEKLIVIAETKLDDSQHGKLNMAIRKKVAQSFDVTPGMVKVFRQRWLIKSTAGKMARSDNKAKFLRECQ